MCRDKKKLTCGLLDISPIIYRPSIPIREAIRGCPGLLSGVPVYHHLPVIQMALNCANWHQSKIWFHPISKFKKFAIQPYIINLNGSLASPHKINLKKSGQFKIGQSGAKTLKYLFKLAGFSSKRHQVNYFLSTFMRHVIHFWNLELL